MQGILDLPIVDIGTLADTVDVFPVARRRRDEHVHPRPRAWVDVHAWWDEVTAAQRRSVTPPDALTSGGVAAVVLVGADQDPFLEAVAQSCRRRGMATTCLDHAGAGRYFSIRTAARTTTVSPYCALYVGARAVDVDGCGTSAELEARQQDALLWAVEAWSAAPVVNRPSPDRQGLWYGAETSLVPAGTPATPGPGVPPDAPIARVAVTGQRAWTIPEPAGPDPVSAPTTGPDIEIDSIELVRELRLDLAVVSWANGAAAPAGSGGSRAVPDRQPPRTRHGRCGRVGSGNPPWRLTGSSSSASTWIPTSPT